MKKTNTNSEQTFHASIWKDADSNYWYANIYRDRETYLLEAETLGNLRTQFQEWQKLYLQNVGVAPQFNFDDLSPCMKPYSIYLSYNLHERINGKTDLVFPLPYDNRLERKNGLIQKIGWKFGEFKSVHAYMKYQKNGELDWASINRL